MTRSRMLTVAISAAALAAIALPAGTGADPRPPSIPLHTCGFTPVEGHGIRITHVSATHPLGQVASAHARGCERAEHIVKNEFLHRETCVVNTGSTCNLGQYGPHNVYYEISCRHSWDPDLHHYHHCKNQSSGAQLNISWHRKH